jgi:hypothetical protein
MGALLALLPSRDWFYGAIIVALGAFCVYEHFHLIDEGEAKIVAADKTLAATVAAKDKIIHDNAQLELVDVGQHEKIALVAPAIPNAGLVCNAPRSPVVAATASNPVKPPDQSVAVRTGSFDPSGTILTLLSDSDTQVNALIEANEILAGYIEALSK